MTNKRTLNKDEKQFGSECLQKQPYSEVGKRCAKCDEVSFTHISYYAVRTIKTIQIYYLPKEILANGVEYGRVKYHRKCFSCSECKRMLSGQYNVKDGMLFCQDCGTVESNQRNNRIKSKMSGHYFSYKR